ncbi:MAG TPA: sugar phosphate isomerase/epimerase [Pyrinomonadaceae bacterium]|nr:sugar phosphate isomerase/epimerase [Pyrinomonadaceae bacterium]
MISRRYFLSALPLSLTSAAVAAKTTSPARLRVGCQTNAWRIDPRDFTQVLSVLSKLKGLGYRGFETGFRNIQGQFKEAVVARRELDKIGLVFFGAHIFLEKYDGETQIAPYDLVTQVVDGAARLGAERLILSGGGLSAGGALDVAALARKARGLNAAGTYARSKGLRLNYHNHWQEFSLGGAEIEGLFRDTAPESVRFVLDCGHAFRAKVEVAEFFTRHHARIDGLHLRDFRGDNQVPLGQGEFDLKALAAAVKETKWRGWLLNEEERADGSKPGEAAVVPARQTVRKVFGV